MRPYLLAALITFASVSLVAAQTIPTIPPTTYPEPGTFCGFLKLCPKDTVPGDED
jgi:hypothetical protein